ncbi:hypothetical protein VCR14J2_260383 [Vibrio coralliirubri]|uniref:hypothetical protein n=1 Tax=Vibrio coralliirubri TaxID=1516159 RepID=UPI0006397898|nr:hypothetical protein [Vibrio coralliirubri]CDT98519.1 hypothetical protein VCR14J2_260383 [Vibrio coralliirubri]
MHYFIDDNGTIRAYESPQQARKGLTPILESEALELAEQKDELAEAQQWAKGELIWCDIQRAYHDTGDFKRAVATAQEINKYAILCRDFVFHSDSGDLQVASEKPIRPDKEIFLASGE